MKLLHEGLPEIVFLGHSVKTRLAQPVVTGPVLEGDTPGDAAGVTLYGSVLHDGGRFRMWYQGYPAQVDAKAVEAVTIGYAESSDGLHWHKPNLGLVAFAGSAANNLVPLPFTSPSVFIDPTAPPSHRYRATGYYTAGLLKTGPSPPGATSGYYTAHSADGFQWQLDASTPRWPGGDVIRSCWDPYQNCGHIALKQMVRSGGIFRRNVYTARLENGVYSDAHAALLPDDYDDIRARESGGIAGDYYGMGWYPQPDVTFGIVENFRIDLPLAISSPESYRPTGLYGQIDFSVVLRDEPLGCWRHLPGRPTLLATGDSDSWYGGSIYTASNVICVGDEEWLYFCGSQAAHGAYLDPLWKLAEHRLELARKHSQERIGLLRWKAGRLLGLEVALYDEITFDMRAAEAGDAFYLNARALGGGSIRAELFTRATRQPLPGYSLAESIPLTGDHLRAPLTWQKASTLPPQQEGSEWRMRLCLERATLHGYEFASATST